VSRDFPKVAFEHATGYKTGLNLGIYDIRTYEGACLNGTTWPPVQDPDHRGPPHPDPGDRAQHQCLHPVRPGGEPKIQTRVLGQHLV
jgi:simple sugar transport system substrate-binding protein